MAFDRITDAIAHFIGLFELLEDRARLKAEFDSFKAGASDTDLPGVVVEVPPAETPFEVPDHVPEVSDISLPPPGPVVEISKDPVNASSAPVADTVAPPSARLAPQEETVVQNRLSGGEEVGPIVFEATPPGSVAVVTIQVNYVADSDVVSSSPVSAEAWMVQAADRIDHLTEIAETLAGPMQDTLGPDSTPAELVANAQEKIEALRDGGMADALAGEVETISVTGIASDAAVSLKLPSPDTSPEDGAAAPPPVEIVTHVAFQNGAGETRVDGESADYAAAKDALTKRLDDRLDAPETTESSDTAPVSVSTGDNVAINSTVIADGWIDAPVIGVWGDAHFVTGITQINVVSDANRVEIAPAGDPGETSDTETPQDTAPEVTNIASIEAVPVIAETTSLSLNDAPPSVIIVATVEGDLMSLTHTTQVNFVTDTDVVTVSNDTETRIEVGGNLVTDGALLALLGAQYDAIFVEGDLIVYRWVTQVNVLADDDVVIAPSIPAASKEPVSDVDPVAEGAPETGDPIAISDGEDGPDGSATSSEGGTAEAPAETPTVTLAASSKPKVDVGEKTISPPGPKTVTAKPTDPAPKAAAPEKPDTPAPAETKPSEANLVVNSARISGPSDEVSGMAKPVAPILSDGELDIEALAASGIDDGGDGLDVLHVKGDLVILHHVSQTNIVSDSDRVEITAPVEKPVAAKAPASEASSKGKAPAPKTQAEASGGAKPATKAETGVNKAPKAAEKTSLAETTPDATTAAKGDSAAAASNAPEKTASSTASAKTPADAKPDADPGAPSVSIADDTGTTVFATAKGTADAPEIDTEPAPPPDPLVAKPLVEDIAETDTASDPLAKTKDLPDTAKGTPPNPAASDADKDAPKGKSDTAAASDTTPANGAAKDTPAALAPPFETATTDTETQNATDAAPEVETDGNTLVNLAEVIDLGGPSSVLVGGEIYSDAVIYQAEFIDTGPENAPAQGDLTPAAVAFLSEDIAQKGKALGHDKDVPGKAKGHLDYDDAVPADVMQTMIA
ncbi:hypothetical protein [Litorisediminicola beolgyonensis]|uniref:Uncharacterized protein n=1 Tax=Litorisediminicola beolgyonensis TaxID=1173614 RepID=A0ABW3ZNP1_9RHOB